jgi:ABC-type polysaccharide/polyol phosphate export permease
VRQIAALLGIAWATLNAIVGAFFVTGAFTATTAQKEGIAAQLALLVGGMLIITFGWLLTQQSWRLLRQRTQQ